MDQGSLMRYGDEGFRKFNMVNNINYDINNWMNVSMKTSYIRTELDGLAQDAVHGESWIGNDTQPLMPVNILMVTGQVKVITPTLPQFWMRWVHVRPRRMTSGTPLP